MPLSLPEAGLGALFGVHDENLRLLEDAFGVTISARGGEVSVSGPEEGRALAARLLSDFARLIEKGLAPKKHDLVAAVRILKEDPDASLVDFFENRAMGPALRQVVSPRNVRQQDYLSAILENDIVFAIGPAGTGKTYLAVAMAAAALLEKRVKRIVLCRPAVEAGEKLGFLPGDLAEKVNPYLRPLHDALYDILGYEKVGKMLERNIIEVAPLAFMRGRTLNDAFVILDEAQNTTSEQMKMFLTRLGFGSKAVVTGDVTQVDLPHGKV
ncbi:MAG: PhoH family protein, partial [Acidobacteria bacterium]|nr:PhoH family protein [Acidobacteriota bacterium]